MGYHWCRQRYYQCNDEHRLHTTYLVRNDFQRQITSDLLFCHIDYSIYCECWVDFPELRKYCWQHTRKDECAICLLAHFLDNRRRTNVDGHNAFIDISNLKVNKRKKYEKFIKNHHSDVLKKIKCFVVVVVVEAKKSIVDIAWNYNLQFSYFFACFFADCDEKATETMMKNKNEENAQQNIGAKVYHSHRFHMAQCMKIAVHKIDKSVTMITATRVCRKAHFDECKKKVKYSHYISRWLNWPLRSIYYQSWRAQLIWIYL